MEKPRMDGISRLVVLCIFVLMCGVFLGIGGLLAGWTFAKPLLIGSGFGMVAIFWFTDALKPKTFERFSSRKRKQD